MLGRRRLIFVATALLTTVHALMQYRVPLTAAPSFQGRMYSFQQLTHQILGTNSKVYSEL